MGERLTVRKRRGGKAPPGGTSISPAASSKPKRALSQIGKANIPMFRVDSPALPQIGPIYDPPQKSKDH